MLTQTAIYALRAMGFMAAPRPGGPVLSKVIAEKTNIPHNFLSKIMNRLVQAGYLQSIRGTNGGFVLSKSPEEINLLEIAALFMRLDNLHECFLGMHRCNGTCRLHDKWQPVANEFFSMLGDTRIDQVFQDQEQTRR